MFTLDNMRMVEHITENFMGKSQLLYIENKKNLHMFDSWIATCMVVYILCVPFYSATGLSNKNQINLWVHVMCRAVHINAFVICVSVFYFCREKWFHQLRRAL